MVKHSTVAMSILFAALGAMAHGGEILLLDFSSPTCGPCQQMIPTVSSLEQAGYPVRKVDATQEPRGSRGESIAVGSASTTGGSFATVGTGRGSSQATPRERSR